MVRFLNSQSLRFHSSPFKDIYSICVSFCPLTFILQLVRNHDVIITYLFWIKLLWKIYRSKKLNVKVISFPDPQSSCLQTIKLWSNPLLSICAESRFSLHFCFCLIYQLIKVEEKFWIWPESPSPVPPDKGYEGSRSEFGVEAVLGHWRLDTFTISVRERTTQLGFSLLVMFVEIQSKAKEPQADILVTSEHHKKLLNHILEEKNIKISVDISDRRIPHRGIFNGVLEVIRYWFVFALLRSVIGPEKIVPLSPPIRSKIRTAFPRPKQFVCFHSELSLVNVGVNFCPDFGRWDDFGFSFSTPNWLLLYWPIRTKENSTRSQWEPK